MSLVPVESSRWLTQGITEAEVCYKRHLLEQRADRVYACASDDTWASRNRWAEAQLWTAAVAQGPLAVHCEPSSLLGEPLNVAVSGSPMVALALQVPEDLCLLWRGASEYELLSACVCQPSYWDLTQKVGLGLRAIHAPVAELGPVLAGRMAHFFDHLPDDQVFERRNWFVHGSGEGYQSQRDRLDYRKYSGSLYLRSERQSLRRIDRDLIVFSIRVDLEPLDRIIEHPQALSDLRLAVEALSGTALSDFGGVEKKQRVLSTLNQYQLDQCAAQ